jgi:hypothetical protein
MAKTTSMPHWAQALSEFTKTEAALATLPMWQAAAAAGQFLVPPDGDLPGSNDQGDTATLELVVGKKLTRSLLTDSVTNWRLQPQELMLTAFAATIGEWLGRVNLAIDMEGHGRELISSEVDLLRTVGWITSLQPVSLSLVNASSDADRLRAVKAQLRNIPNGGIAYGALRYLSASPEIRAALDAPTSPLLFSYLGQWRRHATSQSWLTFEKPVMASYGSFGSRRRSSRSSF